MYQLACGLRDNGRWDEAEVLFREVLRLEEEGGPVATIRSVTLDALARGLREYGRPEKAERLLRETLCDKEEGAVSAPTQTGLREPPGHRAAK